MPPTKAKEYEFSWRPGWSFSRMRTLRTCKRQYWYHYYGKRFIDRAERPLLLDLARLTTMAIEAGTAVHETIEEVIKDLQLTGRVADEEKAMGIAVNKFKVLVRNGQLFEDRYGNGSREGERERCLERVRAGITGYFRSGWHERLLEAPEEGRSEWIVDPPGYGEFRFEGMKVYAKPDLIFKSGDDRWNVIDWKTGRPGDADIEQVQCYMFFAHEVFDIPLEESTGFVEYLSDPDEDHVVVHGTEVDPIGLRTRIIGELREIEALVKDLESNEPVDLQNFPPSVSVRNCMRCNYRMICKPELGPRTAGLMEFDGA